MQNKGLISAVAGILIVLCLYQLIFTWKSSQVENKAVALSEQLVKSEDANKLFAGNPKMVFQYNDSISHARTAIKNRYLDSISTENVLNLLVAKYTYKDCKEMALNLGLDLQGGMNTVLQVNMKDLLLGMSDNSPDKSFNEALDLAQKNSKTSTKDYITLFQEAFQQINPNGKLASIYATRKYQDRIKFNTTNDEVIKLIRSEADGAIENTYNIISSRIDKFGVSSPTVTLDKQRGRISVELAGVDNPQRVRKLLQATANLEFWETYTADELGQSINDANDALKTYLAYEKAQNKGKVGGDSSKISASSFLNDDTTKSEDKSDLLSTLGDTGKTTKKDTAKKKGDKPTEEEFKDENPLFGLLQPAVDKDNHYVKSPVLGYTRGRDTAELNLYLSVPDVKNTFPADIKFLWGAKSISEKEPVFQLYAIKKQPNDNKAPLDGSAVTNAKQDIDQYGKADVSMSMNAEGSRTWKNLTGSNVGKFVAIALDDQIYSAPRVNEEIGGGTSSISGDFTIQEAQDLANVLQTGKLPAKAEIMEEEVVGPTLGKESIRAGLMSLLIAFFLIIAFMIFYYNTSGLVADTVLFLNLFFIIGILATPSLGASLTLPGIAGIVLTLGMAVDANVIINERIREELRAGKTLKIAVSEGFKHSLSAIIDGHVTSLLTAFILAWVGMGPVKGFAVTLIIGLLCSLFTAVVVAHVIMEKWLEKGRTFKFETPWVKNFLQNVKFDFLGKRKYSYIFSLCTIIFGLTSFFTRGFEMGVDFAGGRDYKVRFEEAVKTENVKKSLDVVFHNTGTVVKTYGSSNQVKITTSYLINESGEAVDQKAETKLFEGLKPYLEPHTTFNEFKQNYLLSSVKVAPTISASIKRSSTIAVILSLIVIFIYILVRFRKVEYSVGAIASTAHDALFVLAIYSIFAGVLPFSLEVDQTFIAAILTIIGFSLNDTVVIFDRLREYLKKDPKSNMASVCNDAINSTLTRTVNTSLTVFLVVAILFLFGGEAVKGFSFAMMVGVVIGCYSSIFIATPIMVDIAQFREKKAKVLPPVNTVTKKK